MICNKYIICFYVLSMKWVLLWFLNLHTLCTLYCYLVKYNGIPTMKKKNDKYNNLRLKMLGINILLHNTATFRETFPKMFYFYKLIIEFQNIYFLHIINTIGLTHVKNGSRMNIVPAP